jgi:hypothetical protein
MNNRKSCSGELSRISLLSEVSTFAREGESGTTTVDTAHLAFILPTLLSFKNPYLRGNTMVLSLSSVQREARHSSPHTPLVEPHSVSFFLRLPGFQKNIENSMVRNTVVANRSLLEVVMVLNLDHKLDCKDCGTIYLDIPSNANSDTPIHCSTCGIFLGRWGELETDFARQGGQSGVFHMEDGQITPIVEGRKPFS